MVAFWELRGTIQIKKKKKIEGVGIERAEYGVERENGRLSKAFSSMSNSALAQRVLLGLSLQKRLAGFRGIILYSLGMLTVSRNTATSRDCGFCITGKAQVQDQT
jgi:hypothetical protein